MPVRAAFDCAFPCLCAWVGLRSWDRQPYLTTVRTGEPDMIMQWREIHHNFFIDNYSPQEAVDNDDGSAFCEAAALPARIDATAYAAAWRRLNPGGCGSSRAAQTRRTTTSWCTAGRA